MSASDIEFLRSQLRQYPDFPQKGILFEDILPLFKSPKAFKLLVHSLAKHIKETHGQVDVIVGLDARGFLFGPTLALELDAAFVPVRKLGKLPGQCVTAEYIKEYGKDIFAMQEDAISQDQRVIIVDDIIATGGSAGAAGKLVKMVGGKTMEYVFLLELDFLKGRDQLDAPVFTLLKSQETKQL
ncbi:adenine phosphoribosyltransferase [Protomyces lactucae-debilis]|uniref:adenine phosphoribosyltransferase n=1 Tax=Protomyces lactucae-debilis TaxID=2754530 RepID=A0A1Y2FAY0_PROLT|nr:adenine phosphoribosyltransferase [Protomyces lactucae-debilis]ORY80496.1 adenine phosphoribosyltransferase [Protomyces lactucae-debilis]